VNKIFNGLLGFVMVCLAGCEPIHASPQPTLQVMMITSTPSLAAWRKIIGGCGLKIPGIGLMVGEYPAGQPGLSQADLSLRLGTIPDPHLPYSAVIGWDEVTIIVQTENPLKDLTLEDISALFNGKVLGWNDWLNTKGVTGSISEPLQVWTYPPGDDLRDFFQQAINQKTSAGSPPADVNQIDLWTAPDPSAMIQAISQNPGAIGFTLKSNLVQGDPKVRPVQLDANSRDILRLPVTAATKTEPQGLLRQLILCSQAAAHP